MSNSAIDAFFDKHPLPVKAQHLLKEFCCNYTRAIGYEHPILLTIVEKIYEQILLPYSFAPYHTKIQAPFDYYQMGMDFLRPLIDFPHSTVTGHPHLEEIVQRLHRKENVIFLANHQIEADPQALSILLEHQYPQLAEQIICVAGDRVVTDPIAIPFSMGRNLLCIYSKRYIDHPPEKKAEKQLHNQKTMELMSELLKEGGHAIYVAPSGGRDRKDAKGHIQVSSLDPQSVEMFYLMTKKAKRPTFFYPMALSTYHLLPPPETIQKELGEERRVGQGPIHLWVGPCIDMEHFPGKEETDKRKRRELRALYIWQQIDTAYRQFPH